MVIRPIQQWKNDCLKFPAYILTLPLVILMALIVHCRMVLKRFSATPKHPDIPVIMIGSVFVGGSGKTPVTEFLAIECQRRGLRVAVVSNGFRKKSKGEILVSDGFRFCADVEQAGDEAYMLARRFLEDQCGIPVVSGRDRINAVDIIKKLFQSDLIIMDDGMQYRKFNAHYEIATFDFAHLKHRYWFLPWGNLRDGLSRIRDSHAVMITKIPEGEKTDESTKQRIKRITRRETVLDSLYIPYYLKEWFNNRRLDLQSLSGKKIIMFSGLAYNPSFFEMVNAMTSSYNFIITDHIEFNDHHWYSPRDCQRLLGKDCSDSSVIWLTTEKDAVKLKEEWFPETDRHRLWTLISRADIVGLSPWLESTLSSILPELQNHYPSTPGASRA